MKRRNIIVTGILFFMICCCTNSKNASHRRYYIQGANEWNVQYYINDEPAFIAYGSYGEEVTRYIKDGKNYVKIFANPIKKKNNKVHCHTFLLEGDNTLTENKIIDGILQKDSFYNSTEKQFSFNANFQRKCIWEMSDEIETFTEKDKDEIIQKVNFIQKTLTSKKLTKLDDIQVVLWNVDEHIVWDKLNKKYQQFINSIWKYKDYEEEIAKKEELSFFPGKKTVTVLSNGSSILYLGDSNIEQDKIRYIVNLKKLCFVKINKKWEVLAF